MCAFCQVKESSSAGECLVCSDCVGRRGPQAALGEMCVGNGYASTFCAWVSHASLRFRYHVCLGLDSAQRRNAVLDEFASRCDPTSIRRDKFVVRPWTAQVRRASSGEVRPALLRIRNTSPPSRASGQEDVLGQRGVRSARLPRR